MLNDINIALGYQIQQLPHARRNDIYHQAVQPEGGTSGLYFIFARGMIHLGTAKC